MGRFCPYSSMVTRLIFLFPAPSLSLPSRNGFLPPAIDRTARNGNCNARGLAGQLAVYFLSHGLLARLLTLFAPCN